MGQTFACYALYPKNRRENIAQSRPYRIWLGPAHAQASSLLTALFPPEQKNVHRTL